MKLSTLTDIVRMIPTWRGIPVSCPTDLVERHDAYQRYMESARWARKRARAIARDGGVCTECGRRGVLHVHHLSYEFFGREPMEDLVTLCEQCHRDIHEEGKSNDD